MKNGTLKRILHLHFSLHYSNFHPFGWTGINMGTMTQHHNYLPGFTADVMQQRNMRDERMTLTKNEKHGITTAKGDDTSTSTTHTLEEEDFNIKNCVYVSFQEKPRKRKRNKNQEKVVIFAKNKKGQLLSCSTFSDWNTTTMLMMMMTIISKKQSYSNNNALLCNNNKLNMKSWLLSFWGTSPLQFFESDIITRDIPLIIIIIIITISSAMTIMERSWRSSWRNWSGEKRRASLACFKTQEKGVERKMFEEKREEKQNNISYRRPNIPYSAFLLLSPPLPPESFARDGKDSQKYMTKHFPFFIALKSLNSINFWVDHDNHDDDGISHFVIVLCVSTYFFQGFFASAKVFPCSRPWWYSIDIDT